MKSIVLCVVGAALLTSCGGKSTSSVNSTPKPADPVAAPAAKSLAELCASTKTVLAAANVAGKTDDAAANGGDGAADGNPGNKVASMKDLEALAKTKSYIELMSRVLDVPAAKRNARWDELVAIGATGYVESAQKKGDARETVFVAQAAINTFPALKKAPAFMAVYTKAAGAGVKACTQASYSGDQCVKLAKEIALTNSDNVAVLKDVADAVYGSTGAKYVAAPFYDALTIGRANSEYCKDVSLVDSITSALQTPADDDVAASARDVAAYWCFAEFEGKIKASLSVAEPNTYLVENGCAVLNGKGAAK
ncbi:MAG TPA: hypothetical protein PLF40_27175 [Kofleriaceae bacterium]|nr:hypothetical protein [Kofleriaceae bacterium]